MHASGVSGGDVLFRCWICATTWMREHRSSATFGWKKIGKASPPKGGGTADAKAPGLAFGLEAPVPAPSFPTAQADRGARAGVTPAKARGKASPPASDLDRIDVDNPQQAQIWANSIGVSVEQLKQAVDAVGDDARDVRRFLRKNWPSEN